MPDRFLGMPKNGCVSFMMKKLLSVCWTSSYRQHICWNSNGYYICYSLGRSVSVFLWSQICSEGIVSQTKDWWDPFNQAAWKTWRFRFPYRKLPFNTAIYPSLQLMVYISQLIRYTIAYSSYGDFIDRGRLLTKKLVDQDYTLEKLKISFRKCYGR